MKTVKLSIIAAALVSTTAMANVVTDAGKTIFKTATNPAAVSLEVGTLGYGANIGWALNDRVELQAGWAGGNIADIAKDNIEVDGVDYQVKTDFSNPYLGVQLRPAANWFTVGAGVISADSSVEIKAPAGNKTINNVTYNNVSDVEGEVRYRNKIAPYLTVGFRPNLNNNWGVFGEVGATYLDDPEVTINSSDAGFNDAAKASIEDNSLIKSGWLPIVKVGATYRF